MMRAYAVIKTALDAVFEAINQIHRAETALDVCTTRDDFTAHWHIAE